MGDDVWVGRKDYALGTVLGAAADYAAQSGGTGGAESAQARFKLTKLQAKKGQRAVRRPEQVDDAGTEEYAGPNRIRTILAHISRYERADGAQHPAVDDKTKLIQEKKGQSRIVEAIPATSRRIVGH